jgi:sensor histidine kinase YesM
VQIYYRKKRWKWLLFGTAVVIIVGTLWYTNILVREIARDERMSIQIWAEAIKRKADLVNYTKRFFDQIKVEERKRAEILAMVYENLGEVSNSDSKFLNFMMEIMARNTTIPIIITDEQGVISDYTNISEEEMEGVQYMTDSLQLEFSSFEPIRIYLDEKSYVLLHFKESTIYSELREVLNDLIQSFFSEVVGTSASVPVLITDSTRQNIIESGNIDENKLSDPVYRDDLIEKMAAENDPILIDLPEYGQSYIYYMNSALIDQITYYPYVMLIVIGVFLLIAYFLFSTSRNAEQNLVWIGMSKETAHQLGTPLSSLIAWVELLKMKGEYHDELVEIEKDIKRLENITDRFSKIGSPARLEPENITGLIYETIDYLRPRTSSRVKFEVNLPPDHPLIIPVNKHLFEWVVENVCKNAVDAMNGNGTISINILEDEKHVFIDFEDTGKGIQKSYFKTIFNPGFTSKKRGWGLGLSLSKRIIENYHRGKIFVRSSVIDKGTVIRVTLRK